MIDTKLQLRKHFQKKRQQISEMYRKSAAQAAANLLIQQKIFQQSKHIACYFSFRDEFESMAIMEAIWQAGKFCYLPVLTNENNLSFVRYHKGDVLHSNRYSIQEPANVENAVAARDLDIVIAPLVAFDLQGHRLGTGGGYYDKTFAFLRGASVKRPCMVGLAFAEQQAEALPWDEWDVPLNAALTEREFILLACQN